MIDNGNTVHNNIYSENGSDIDNDEINHTSKTNDIVMDEGNINSGKRK